MVLDEGNKGGEWQLVTRLSALGAATVARCFSLIDEALGQGATQGGEGLLRVIAVIAAGFPRQQHMTGVMKIVVPLRVLEALRTTSQQTCLISVVLEYEVHMAVGAA